MDKKILKELSLIPIAMFILTIIYTMLVKFVDVEKIGPYGSEVGFSSINKVFRNSLDYNGFFYYLTQILGYVALLVCLFMAVLGLIQLIKRKSIKKVDQYILLLGLIYLITIFFYVFFMVVVVNYRPIGDELESSYPSSHTMLAIVVFFSAPLVLGEYIKDKKMMLALKIVMYSLIVITVVGRVLSGVHWITDIFGGALYATSILTLLYFLKIVVDMKLAKVNREKVE